MLVMVALFFNAYMYLHVYKYICIFKSFFVVFFFFNFIFIVYTLTRCPHLEKHETRVTQNLNKRHYLAPEVLYKSVFIITFVSFEIKGVIFENAE